MNILAAALAALPASGPNYAAFAAAKPP